MTVVQPNSIAGINSISVQSGQSLSIHKSDGTLIREIVASTGISTFSSISVGSATTTNSAGKSINIGLGASISQHADNTLSFGTNGIVRARIDSSGRLLINKTSGSFGLEVGAGSDSTFRITNVLESSHGSHDAKIVAGGSYYQNPNIIGSAIKFSTYNGSAEGERARFDSAGKLGIGTAAPGQTLHLSAASGDVYNRVDTNVNGGMLLYFQGTQRSVFANDSAFSGTSTDTGIGAKGNLIFRTGTSSYDERLRIDTDGRLLIGSAANSHNGGDLLQLSATSSTASIQLNRYTANAHPSYLNFFKSRNASISGQTVVQDDDTLGMLAFYGSDGTDRALGAEVCAQVDGTPGSNDMPSRLVFRTSADGSQSPTERLRITSGGFIGAGTAAPRRHLHIHNSASATVGFQMTNGATGESNDSQGFQLKVASDLHAEVAQMENSYLSFYTNAAEKLRITTSGQILMGGNTAYNVFENSSTAPRLQVRGTNLSGSCQAWIRATADAGGPKLFLANTRSTAEGGQTVVQSGDELGGLYFTGSDGTQFVDGASIRSYVGTTPGADDMPGYLSFWTTADGAATSTERARFTHDGKYNFGHASNNAGSNGRFYVTSIAGQSTMDLHHSVNDNENVLNMIHGGVGVNGNPTRVVVEFRNFANNAIATIQSNSTTVSYNTGSDYRMKENQVDISDGITRVKQLKPYRFNWKSEYGGGDKVDGFFAHEAATVVPEAVQGTKDAVDSNGDIIRQQIDQAKLVPVLTAALQEAITKIETLETKVAALESS